MHSRAYWSDKHEKSSKRIPYAIRANKLQRENQAHSDEKRLFSEKRAINNANEKKNRDCQRQVPTLNCIRYFGSIWCSLVFGVRREKQILHFIVILLSSFRCEIFIYDIQSSQVFVVTQSKCIQSTTIRKIIITISTTRLWPSSVSSVRLWKDEEILYSLSSGSVSNKIGNHSRDARYQQSLKYRS